MSDPAQPSIRKRRPPFLDWAEHREELKTLYLTLNWTLPDVMRYMAKHRSFEASLKTYKARLREWGFRKYKQEAMMKAADWRRRQPDRQGKSSTVVFKASNLVFIDADIDYYFKRRSQYTQRPISEPGTPEPDMILDMACLSPAAEGLLLSPRLPRLSVGHIGESERTLINVHDFFRASTATNSDHVQKRFLDEANDPWLTWMHNIVDSINCKQPFKALAEIRKACLWVEQHPEELDLKMVISICSYRIDFKKHGILPLFDVLLKHIIGVSKQRLGAEHPVPMIAKTICKTSEAAQLSDSIFALMTNDFQCAHQYTPMIPIQMRYLVAMMHLGEPDADLVFGEWTLRQIYKDAVAILGEQDEDMLRLRCDIGGVIRRARRWSELVDLYADVIEICLAGTLDQPNIVPLLQTAQAKARLGHMVEAEDLLRRTLDYTRRVCGSQDPKTLRTANQLVDLLVLMDAQDEAEKLRQFMKRAEEQSKEDWEKQMKEDAVVKEDIPEVADF